MQDIFLIVVNMIMEWFKAQVTERGISALAIGKILHSLGIAWGELNKSSKRKKNTYQTDDHKNILHLQP